MKLFVIVCFVAFSSLMVACGGEMEQVTVGQAEQAQDIGNNYISTLINSTQGVIIGTGLWIGPNQVLVNAFHAGLSHWSSGTLKACERSRSDCATLTLSNCTYKLGVWAACPAAVTNADYYWSDFSYYFPGSYVKAWGSGRTTDTGAKGTNPANWVLEDEAWKFWRPRVVDVNGITHVGSNNLCTPYGMAAYCYDYSSGTTYMWAFDGAPQFKYGNYFVGMGFGNIGAAWANTTILSWLDDVGGLAI